MIKSTEVKFGVSIKDDHIAIPDDHKTLVLQRIKSTRQNPARMLSWDKASRRLRP